MTAELQDEVAAPIDGQEAPEAAAEPSDLDLIMPEGGVVTVGGIQARVRRLRTFEFLGLMRVITNGLGPQLGELKLTTDDQEQMKANLLSLVIGAMPNAAEEFIQFLRLILEPVSVSETAALAVEMQNPDPSDTMDIIGVLVEQEAPDLSVLAGKAQAWVSKIQLTLKKQTPHG